MERDQKRLNLEGLVKKLRSVTLAVQIMPFVYSALYIISISLYWTDNPILLAVLDTLFYVSPITVTEFYILSNALRLCKWHKAACILPVTPQVAVLVDKTVVNLSAHAVEACLITSVIMVSVLLISAYKVFIYGR